MHIPKVDDVLNLKDKSFEGLHAYMRDNDIPHYLSTVNKKYVKFEFAEVFESREEIGNSLCYAAVGKKAFLNNLAIVMRYVNYFIHYFDPDHELMMAYFMTMYLIMDAEEDFRPENLMFTLKNYFVSERMVEKIAKMVEHNINETAMKKADRKYDESLQLTTDHLKCIMAISIVHKIMIPIISQYVKVRKGSMDITERQLYFKCFTCFIDVFDERFGVSFYEKIYHTATTRVSKTNTDQKLMWMRRKSSGVTQTAYVNTLMHSLFIEISQKALFAQSAISFIHVCFDNATTNELRQQDTHEFSDLSMTASDPGDEEVNKFDRMMITNAQFSERDIMLSKQIIKDTISRLAEVHGIEFSKEELDFYKANTKMIDIQANVIFLYFSSSMYSYEVLKHVKKDQLIKLMIIMKTILKKEHYTYLPQIISGVMDKTKAKRYNKKKIETFISKHPCYPDIKEQYEFSSAYLNKDKLLEMAKTLISCPVSIVDYDQREHLGERIDINDVATLDELVNLFKNL